MGEGLNKPWMRHEIARIVPPEEVERLMKEHEKCQAR
jgi:hypothetical protein